MNRLLYLAQRTIGFQQSMEPLLRKTKLADFGYSNLRTFQSTYLNNLKQQQKSSNSENTNNANAQKKAKTSPKITLIAPNQSISVTSLEEAHKLAKRRDLHLQLVQEMCSKTQRPIYKLVTQAELLAEELSDFNIEEKTTTGKNATKKSEKTLTIGSRISDNDLASRQKNIAKWLSKQHEVRILIQGGADDMPKMEKICKAIEQSIKEPELVGKIQQKQSKGTHIKFSIVPVVNAAAKNDEHIAGKAKTPQTAA